MKQLSILAWTFFWINSVTLGGGMAMLPLIEREFVEKRGWLTSDEMLDAVAVMQSLPGLIAVNMAVLIGYRVKGILGAVMASLATVTTPFLAIALLAHVFSALSESPTVEHVFLGVRAGTAALVMMSLAKMTKAALREPLAWVLAVAGFIAAVVLKADLTLVVLLGGVVGLALVVVGVLKRSAK